jgi:PhnB protein
LTAPHILIGASDMSEGAMTMGTAFSLCLDCESDDEMQKLWKGLGKGGKVNHEISSVGWGKFGDLTDKYGVDWMFNLTSPGMGAEMG